MSAQLKLCKDCKHCLPDEEWLGKHKDENSAVRFAKCQRTLDVNHTSRYVGYDPKKEDMRYCSSERLFGRYMAWVESTCGQTGRYWEAK